MPPRRPKSSPPAAKPRRDPADAVEAATQRIGRELWAQLERRRPTVFEQRWILDHVMEWAMADESVKVQMFRFVDVLPMLRSHESVTEHLQEYFEEVRSRLPWAVRMAVEEGHLRADTHPHQLVFELHGLILALHHDARFLRNPGALDRVRTGFERLIAYYAVPAQVAAAARPARKSRG